MKIIIYILTSPGNERMTSPDEGGAILAEGGAKLSQCEQTVQPWTSTYLYFGL